MTTLSSTDDLLRAARENTEFREAFRREILTDELLNLPARFAERSMSTDRKIAALTDTVDSLARNLAEYQISTDRKIAALTDTVDSLARNLAEYQISTDRKIAALTDTVDSLARNLAEYQISTDRKIAALTDAVSALTRNLAEYQKTTNERLDRMEETIRDTRTELGQDIRSLHGMYSQQHDDYERFRGAYSENSARKDDSLIAANIARVRGNRVLMSTRLSRDEMSDIFREAVERDLLSGIDDESQDRFVNADDALLVTERGRARSQFYIVIEASHTAERNDLVRVVNHAKVIERVTGIPAYGIVAGVRIGRDMPSDLLLQDAAPFVRDKNADAALWHPLRRQFMDPMTEPQ